MKFLPNFGPIVMDEVTFASSMPQKRILSPHPPHCPTLKFGTSSLRTFQLSEICGSIFDAVLFMAYNLPDDLNDLDLSAEYTVTFNGTTMPVEIEPEMDGGYSLPQREALRQLLSLPADVLETSAPAVVQNYEVYREAIGDEELPSLQNPADVWKRVEPTTFLIPAHGGVTTATFFLLAECDWDPEHGLVVRFRNGLADAASQQGELDLED